MSNIFANKKGVASEKIEDDFVGGGGVFDTDIYSGTIKYAYLGKSSRSEARSLNYSIVIGTKEHNGTIWMTNGQGGVTYEDKKTGEEKNLPGFNQVNSLAMLLLSKEVGELEVEEKTLSLYDFESKKEIPQAVQCFTELHGEEVQIALQRQTVDKTQKNEATGMYDPTGETRDVNEIVKFFPADKLVTISEVARFVQSLGGEFDDVLKDGDLGKAIAKMEDGDYASTWLAKNRGQIYNKAKGASKGGKSFEKTSGGDGSSNKAKKSLFDD